MRHKEKINISGDVIESIERYGVMGLYRDEIAKLLCIDVDTARVFLRRMTDEKKRTRTRAILMRRARESFYDERYITAYTEGQRHQVECMRRQCRNAHEISLVTSVRLRDVIAMCYGTDYINKFHFNKKEIKTIKEEIRKMNEQERREIEAQMRKDFDPTPRERTVPETGYDWLGDYMFD